MTKSELIDALGAKTGLPRNKVQNVVDLFFNEIAKTLAGGGRVEIRGFCSLFVKSYKAYTGRNPKTGALTHVPPKKLPFFRCGQELKDRVDYREGED